MRANAATAAGKQPNWDLRKLTTNRRAPSILRLSGCSCIAATQKLQKMTWRRFSFIFNTKRLCNFGRNGHQSFWQAFRAVLANAATAAGKQPNCDLRNLTTNRRAPSILRLSGCTCIAATQQFQKMTWRRFLFIFNTKRLCNFGRYGHQSFWQAFRAVLRTAGIAW